MPLFGPPNINKLKAANDVTGLIKALSYQKDIRIRQEAAIALGQIGDARATEPLIEALHEVFIFQKDFIFINAVIWALGEIGDPRAADPLADLAVKQSDVRAKAFAALLSLGASAVEALCRIVNSDDADVGHRAIVALVQIGDARLVQGLAKVVERVTFQHLRREAAEALILFGDPQGLQPIIFFLHDKQPPWVRLTNKRLPNALGREPDWDDITILFWASQGHWERCTEFGARAAPIMLEIIKSCESVCTDSTPFEPEASHAIEVLVKIGEPEAIAYVVSRLHDPDYHVRFLIAGWLQKAGWQPEGIVDEAAYCIAAGDVDRLEQLDIQAIKPLMMESMDWQFASYQENIKATIAKLLTRPEAGVDAGAF